MPLPQELGVPEASKTILQLTQGHVPPLLISAACPSGDYAEATSSTRSLQPRQQASRHQGALQSRQPFCSGPLSTPPLAAIQASSLPAGQQLHTETSASPLLVGDGILLSITITGMGLIGFRVQASSIKPPFGAEGF